MPLYLLEDYITIIITIKKKVVEQWKSLLIQTQMHCGLHASPSLKFRFSLWFFDIDILVVKLYFLRVAVLETWERREKPLRKLLEKKEYDGGGLAC